MNQNWFVYIAKARTGRLYAGITANPQYRIERHNDGRGSKFAIDQGPFTLEYISLAFQDKSQARKREIQIKGWTHEKKLKLMRGEWK
ncbi:GIY-YIG nuclease family protein [Patescibacteria group bacterium]|nr:GIY-YIG nuclease family protein [Patescibacteria group bacterium]